ncbi:hypothetical protein, partial [Mesorhizobium sp.]|uniref:hypothetical protein n=1 Tax=Mesorhizobium sp. TaxID=1871066 RepID=UPI0026265E78
NSDDLLFREAAAFHVLVLSMGQNELQTGLDQRGKVTMTWFPPGKEKRSERTAEMQLPYRRRLRTPAADTSTSIVMCHSNESSHKLHPSMLPHGDREECPWVHR